MAKQINITVSYRMQRASAEVCEKVGQPLGSIEVLDSDGFRDSFYETEEEAVEGTGNSVADMLGLSGGIALGTVAVEVVDVE